MFKTVILTWRRGSSIGQFLIAKENACGPEWQIIDNNMCPGSSDPFYIVTYYIKWATTFWTHSNYIQLKANAITPSVAIV